MLSLKQIGTICLTIFLSVSLCFASGVSPTATTADCDNATLSTYSGTTNLQADWEPNTINLHWYNGNTELTVPAESQSCVYDGGLTLPATTPTRTGYTFTGWHARPTYDFSTLDTTERAKKRWGINYNGDCMYALLENGYSVLSCDSYAEFGELEQNEWKTHFSWGDIYGSSYCSAKAGDNDSKSYNNASSNWRATYNELESVTGDKLYCWCQATGYKPIGENIIYGPKSVSGRTTWIYAEEESSTYWCGAYCVRACLSRMLDSSGFRSAIFGVTQ